MTCYCIVDMGARRTGATLRSPLSVSLLVPGVPDTFVCLFVRVDWLFGCGSHEFVCVDPQTARIHNKKHERKTNRPANPATTTTTSPATTTSTGQAAKQPTMFFLRVRNAANQLVTGSSRISEEMRDLRRARGRQVCQACATVFGMILLNAALVQILIMVYGLDQYRLDNENDSY